jgi:hypothetical protein
MNTEARLKAGFCILYRSVESSLLWAEMQNTIPARSDELGIIKAGKVRSCK